jgi:fumarylacetoacetate (FAA) hydrolase
MKLASIKNDTRDGALAVVSRDLRHAVIVYEIAPTLQAALDDWAYIAPQLESCYEALNRQPDSRSFSFDTAQCMAPLPRVHQRLVASAYLPHEELLRKARGDVMHENSRRDPLMAQGNSDQLIGACDPLEAASEEWDIDLGAEIAVILEDVPAGIKHDRASECIRLVVLANEISLRSFMPTELAKGLGFINGRSATAFSPVAVTPDELGAAWDGKRVLRPLSVRVNDTLLGEPDCGSDMQFDFPHLIAHAAKTRRLGAGTVLGSGTISNSGHKNGYACIAELRASNETEPASYLRFGDRVRIDMLDAGGASIFGSIDQIVVQHPLPKKSAEQAQPEDAEA